MFPNFALPINATNEQKKIYNKNSQLYLLAFQNRNKYGLILTLCSDLEIHDFIDKHRFINVYPYNPLWYYLAYGRCSYENDI
jgi:hypothetical protein